MIHRVNDRLNSVLGPVYRPHGKVVTHSGAVGWPQTVHDVSALLHAVAGYHCYSYYSYFIVVHGKVVTHPQTVHDVSVVLHAVASCALGTACI